MPLKMLRVLTRLPVESRAGCYIEPNVTVTKYTWGIPYRLLSRCLRALLTGGFSLGALTISVDFRNAATRQKITPHGVPLRALDSTFFSKGSSIWGMRYILALMIAVPLLMAGSAWAGEYDGECVPRQHL